MTLSTSEKISLYRWFFRGRQDIYARRWEKWERSGYTPAYSFDRDEFNAHRATWWTLKTFEHKTLIPLDDKVVYSHLAWKEIIGIYPLLQDNTSHFIVADFDKDTWKDDVKKLHEMCIQFSIPAYIEISRSGNGAHLRIFFEENYQAFRSRRILFELLRSAFEVSIFEKEMSFDRLFPHQDAHTGDGFGNLIALPFFIWGETDSVYWKNRKVNCYKQIYLRL